MDQSARSIATEGLFLLVILVLGLRHVLLESSIVMMLSLYLTGRVGVGIGKAIGGRGDGSGGGGGGGGAPASGNVQSVTVTERPPGGALRVATRRALFRWSDQRHPFALFGVWVGVALALVFFFTTKGR